MKINNYGATGGASPIPYEYSYNSSQPHINCKHQTCPMNVPSVLPNVANRQHYTCLAPTLPKPHYPLPRTIALASLVKGRWIDGKAQTVASLRFTCDTPVFFIHQTFLPSRRRDCLTTIPLSSPTLPKPHYPSPRTITLAI